MPDVVEPSAPAPDEAMHVIRHVVIESASGMVSVARPFPLVMTAGLKKSVSGKYFRIRGGAGPPLGFPEVGRSPPFFLALGMGAASAMAMSITAPFAAPNRICRAPPAGIRAASANLPSFPHPPRPRIG